MALTSFYPIGEPLQECRVTKRNLSFIEITLSVVPLDTSDLGYQEPLPESMVSYSRHRKSRDDKYEGKSR